MLGSRVNNVKGILFDCKTPLWVLNKKGEHSSPLIIILLAYAKLNFQKTPTANKSCAGI